MKTIPFILSLAVFSSFADAAAPAVGSISGNQQFARESGGGFTTANLDEYEGRILILMLMTPWCPICQSNAQAVSNGLTDHFNDPSRGALRGRNDHGVQIESLLLSTEEADLWDDVNKSFSTTNGFDGWGLDADTQRQNARTLLGYYRGGFINSNDLYDWGNDRRRVVVLNLVKGSTSHSFREIVLNQNSYSSGDDAAARAAINGIQDKTEIPLPLIELKQGNTKLENGISKRNFGKAKVRAKGRSITFRIINTGNAPLRNLSLAKAGNHPNDFIVTGPGKTVVAPGKSTTFKVTFMPRRVGMRRATLELRSSDADQSPFDIKVSGLGAR